MSFKICHATGELHRLKNELLFYCEINKVQISFLLYGEWVLPFLAQVSGVGREEVIFMVQKNPKINLDEITKLLEATGLSQADIMRRFASFLFTDLFACEGGSCMNACVTCRSGCSGGPTGRSINP